MRNEIDSGYVRKRELKALKESSTGKYLGLVLFDWAVIVAAFGFAAVYPSLLSYVVAILLIGSRQQALGIIAHDGAHGMVHKKKGLNDFLSNLLCLWPLGSTVSGYRKFHFQHHQFTGEHQDPEKHLLKGPLYQLPSYRLKFVAIFIADLFGLGVPEFINMAKQIRPTKKRDYLALALFWGALIPVFAVTETLWIPLMWFIALGTSFWAFFRIRVWSEHMGIDGTHRFAAGLISRFFFFPNYTFCHYEHHKWPNIPCYNLLKARELDQGTKVIGVRELFDFFENPRSKIDRLERKLVLRRFEPLPKKALTG